jgi:hypothetical protein
LHVVHRVVRELPVVHAERVEPEEPAEHFGAPMENLRWNLRFKWMTMSVWMLQMKELLLHGVQGMREEHVVDDEVVRELPVVHAEHVGAPMENLRWNRRFKWMTMCFWMLQMK